MHELATAPATENSPAGSSPAWGQVLALPCDLSVELPVPGFKVGDVLRLAKQSVIASQWPVGRDIPLRANGELIAWSEFEVVGNRLAVRLTELA